MEKLNWIEITDYNRPPAYDKHYFTIQHDWNDEKELTFGFIDSMGRFVKVDNGARQIVKSATILAYLERPNMF
jgi:hypothetical protein